MRWTGLTGVLAGAVVAVAVLALTESIQAQGARPAAGARIACVNVGLVFDEYQRRKDLNDEMSQVQEQLKAEELQRRQKIDALQAEIDKLDPEDPTYVARQREMLALQIDYKNWGELRRADLTRETAVWMVKIYREILKAVQGVAERDGYDLVLYRGEFEPGGADLEMVTDRIRDHKVLYAHPSIEITQIVLDALNEAYRAQPRGKMLYMP